MTSDETQIQIFADWPMLHVKHVTKDNRKNPEYHFVAAMRKMRKTKTVPQRNHDQTKNVQHIGSEETYGPNNTGQSKHSDSKGSKRKCCWFTQDLLST